MQTPAELVPIPTDPLMRRESSGKLLHFGKIGFKIPKHLVAGSTLGTARQICHLPNLRKLSLPTVAFQARARRKLPAAGPAAATEAASGARRAGSSSTSSRTGGSSSRSPRPGTRRSRPSSACTKRSPLPGAMNHRVVLGENQESLTKA